MSYIFIFMFSTFVTILGSSNNLPKSLSKSERKFVQNVVRIHGSKPLEVIKLKNGNILVNYSDQRIVLGTDGFIHDLEILEDGVWIDLGPEY